MIYLEKNNKKNTNFVKIIISNHLLELSSGVLNTRVSRRTKHCGNYDKALNEAQLITKEYLDKGYKRKTYIEGITEPIILDIAKWHFQGDYPKDLPIDNAYNHTGFFIGWLVENEFLSEDFSILIKDGIKSFIKKEITAPTLFKEYFDGLFETHQINDEITPFVLDYYGRDSNDSAYFSKYLNKLLKDLPSVYNIKDSWDNYRVIKSFIDVDFKKATY